MPTYSSNEKENLSQNPNRLLAGAVKPRRDKLPADSPLLKWGSDLTEDATNGLVRDTFGQDDTISKMIQVLIRSEKNNPILVGLPGTGKSAAVGALAHRINRGEVPDQLLACRIVIINLALLVAGTKYRGELEERAKTLVEIAKKDPNLVYFIDEAHTIIKAGAAEGALDIANILKPAMSRNEIRVIMATTEDEYKKHFEKDEALDRRTELVESPEPTQGVVAKILKFVRTRLEKHHGLSIDDKALIEVYRIAERFIKPIKHKYQPDVSITLADKTCAYVREVRSVTPELRKAYRELHEVEFELIDAERLRDLASINKLHAQARALAEKIAIHAQIPGPPEARIVTVSDVAHAANFWHGIPLGQLSEDESKKVLRLGTNIKTRVIGQDDPIDNIVAAIHESRALGGDPNRPVGSFLFLGPTGVGKTETARALAEFLFDDERAFTKIDMSEFMEKHSVSKLIGAPPGYVGYEEGGQLTNAVAKRPFSVILLDEIEKAHEEIFPILLQVMEDGVLTDGLGNKVDFKNCVLIMTSNLGCGSLRRNGGTFGTRPGQKSEEDNNSSVKAKILKAVNEKFSPEFLGRLDGVEVFNQFTDEVVKLIIEQKLTELNVYLSSKRLTMKFATSIKEMLFSKGYDRKSGVRSLRTTIKKLLRQPIAPRVLAGEFGEGDTILADLDKEGKVTLQKETASAA